MKVPTNKQFFKQIKLAKKYNGIFFGGSYEEGVQYALEWVMGIGDGTKPMAGYKVLLEKHKNK